MLTPSGWLSAVYEEVTIFDERVMLRFPPDLVLLCLFPSKGIIAILFFFEQRQESSPSPVTVLVSWNIVCFPEKDISMQLIYYPAKFVFMTI